MPSSIKLTYFNARGRAETSRLILAMAGADYQDDRLSGEQFAALKPQLTFGQVGGRKHYCQRKKVWTTQM